MRALILKGYHEPLELLEVEDPPVGRSEILLRVRACGVCQTDLKIIRGDIPPPIVTLPHVLGHEVVGEVAAAGEEASGVQVGDIGLVHSYITCRECPSCLAGRDNICVNLKRVGFELPGGFREYMSIPDHAFCPLQGKVPLARMAILADAMGTPYHAITRLAKVRAGQDVLIVGTGGLGIHAVQIAKLCGANVLAVDRAPEALKLAEEFGADRTLTPEEAPQEVQRLTGGAGVDAVIEIVGSPESLSWSLPALKRGGKLVLVGYTPARPFPLDTMAVHYHEYEIIGCRFVTKAGLLELIKLVEAGKLTPVVTRTYPFAQANEALDALREGKVQGRVVLTL